MRPFIMFFFSHGKPVLFRIMVCLPMLGMHVHIDCRRGVMLYEITVCLITKDTGVSQVWIKESDLFS
jgi:hypothetical protein